MKSKNMFNLKTTHFFLSKTSPGQNSHTNLTFVVFFQLLYNINYTKA